MENELINLLKQIYSDIFLIYEFKNKYLILNCPKKSIIFTHCFHFRCSQRQKIKEETKNGQFHITCTIRQDETIPPLAQEEEVQNYDENIEDLDKRTDEVSSHIEDTVSVHMKNETSE